ncbi:hypothetical protein AJ80_05291 [Polytolypa hystricis UAMH7299]|uniref:NADH dehydrogenase [ubiquinone] 1 beta subcomplex subunit 9 n=1 Tax=Polytolypa hystricis (strain UAMH7299) TaxID=1447883 RepID=A0A2B7Y3K6_POLH7|nr:hypothetical protein AJ80_05291 [Polytolypa hystricis UAMH7299]
MSASHTALSLYRRSLRLSFDWAVHRHLWRGQAVYIRSLFDANKNVRDPRQQKILFQETEKLLEKWKHPDPYRAPTAPGGSKYERNVEAPILNPPLSQAEEARLREEEIAREFPDVPESLKEVEKR